MSNASAIEMSCDTSAALKKQKQRQDIGKKAVEQLFVSQYERPKRTFTEERCYPKKRRCWR